MELFFALYSATNSQFVSENFYLKLNNGDEITSAHNIQTMFKDIGKKFFKEELWLVVRIFRVGVMLKDLQGIKGPVQTRQYSTSEVTITNQLRRPVGVAVMQLSSSLLDSLIAGELHTLKPENFPIYTTQKEETFTWMHERTYIPAVSKVDTPSRTGAQQWNQSELEFH